MSTADHAEALFNARYSCAQAVLGALAPVVELDPHQALRLAACFGAGMHRGATCGAVTGALMALGARHGHHIQGDLEQKARAYQVADAFQERFAQEHGSLVCALLLEGDPSNPALRERMEVLWKTRCPIYVRRAVELAEELL